MNILNKLTIKHLKMNKKRTIVSIVGIILSAALMVGIGLLMSTMRENMIDMVISENGSEHVSFYNLKEEDYNYIKDSDKIKEILTSEKIGYARNNLENLDYISYLKVLKADSFLLEKMHLKEGRLPENNKEVIVPKYLKANIGDIITLEVGDRSLEGELLEDTDWQEEESEVSLINTKTITYKVVGILENDIYRNNYDIGIPIYTYQDNQKTGTINSFIYFKNMKDTRNFSNLWKEDLELSSNQVKINESLLDLYGESRYDNFMGAIVSSLTVILVILSIACIIVIYNSFAISVMERKKQFGLLSSIGTTKKQIRKIVFFEAFIVGTIGIVLGILGAYIGIGCVLAIINELVPNIFGAGSPLKLVTYPLFIIIPIIFMIATILISAFLPARSASRITPIEAIRLNDDIKIKGKKVKTPKWIRKVFGMEGEIALKNMKRNKKKYRITVLSLFVSIVLFISFSGYMEYMFTGIGSYASLPEFDSYLTIYQNDNLKDSNMVSFRQEIQKNKEIKKLFNYNMYYLNTTTDLSKKEYYNDKFYSLEKSTITSFNEYSDIFLLEVDKEMYQSMLKAIGKTEEKPILYNHYETIRYTKNTRKSYSINKYTSKLNANIKLCESIYGEEDISYDCQFELDNYYIADIDFFGKDLISNYTSIIFIIPMDYFGDLSEFHDGTQIGTLFSIDKDKNLKEDIERLADKYDIDYNYQNIKEEFQLGRNLVFCVKLLVYGFITLVTLIGVTSVFNTINTSIHLRRKEFAMLRSMGLSSHGFNKILFFESIFFGLKSLLYALPVSIGIIYLLYQSFKGMTDFDMMLVPYGHIFTAVIGVFIIIIISTLYATRKIRKENILEAIREENI